jgi:BirA family transcriptional regulator, biotin operon repressor / biotin---[acetyl-CoA-carboxylase] ligase
MSEDEREPAFLSRLERFDAVDSTQRIVREWLEAGEPEVCVAVADVQVAGRGRLGRGWEAPSGAALLASVGLRPRGLPVMHAWRLAATCALAMLDAAEDAAGLRDGTLWLKWPNDIVAEGTDGRLLKLAGILGESVVEGDGIASAVVGTGVNADWPRATFPAGIAGAMTSLREVAHGRPIDREALLEAYLLRLEPRYLALLTGRFDSGGWSARQRTTGRQVEVLVGQTLVYGRAVGVQPGTGALLVETDGVEVAIDSGEVTRCRVIDLPVRRHVHA